jgi:thiol:disulfide interchange protein DsbA
MQAVLMLLLAVAATAASAQITEGKDYVVLDRSGAAPRPEAAARIEVLEFFSYACPHCARLEPMLDKWRRALPANVVLRRVPVTFGRDEWEALARLYFTLEGADQLEALHGKVFTAIHGEHVNLFTPESAADWIARQGKDRRAFLDRYNSFSVQVKVQGANALAQGDVIESVPSFVIGGRYRTDLDQARSYDHLLSTVDQLVRKSLAEQGGKR